MENKPKFRFLVVKNSAGEHEGLFQMKCPQCGGWATLDHDMLRGDVSILHQCGYHAFIESQLKEV